MSDENKNDLDTKMKVFAEIINQTIEDKSAEELFGLFGSPAKEFETHEDRVLNRLDTIIELLTSIKDK